MTPSSSTAVMSPLSPQPFPQQQGRQQEQEQPQERQQDCEIIMAPDEILIQDFSKRVAMARRRSSTCSSTASISTCSTTSRESLRKQNHLELLSLLDDESYSSVESEYESSPLQIYQRKQLSQSIPSTTLLSAMAAASATGTPLRTRNSAAGVRSVIHSFFRTPTESELQQYHAQDQTGGVPPFCPSLAHDPFGDSDSQSGCRDASAKQVTFSHIGPTMVTAIHHNDYTHEERESSWYSAAELKRIQRHAARLARQQQHGGSLTPEQKQSLRGLEARISSAHKRQTQQRRQDVMNAVFDEQERQWKESYEHEAAAAEEEDKGADGDDISYIFEYDDDLVAEASKTITRQAMKVAYKFAKMDARNARY